MFHEEIFCLELELLVRCHSFTISLESAETINSFQFRVVRHLTPIPPALILTLKAVSSYFVHNSEVNKFWSVLMTSSPPSQPDSPPPAALTNIKPFSQSFIHFTAISILKNEKEKTLGIGMIVSVQWFPISSLCASLNGVLKIICTEIYLMAWIICFFIICYAECEWLNHFGRIVDVRCGWAAAKCEG